jgi:hypothetical protein
MVSVRYRIELPICVAWIASEAPGWLPGASYFR